MNEILKEKVNEWLAWDKNAKTRGEIEELVKSNKFDELTSRLLKRMEFGTAGLRARMGAGYSMMNDLTIVQTAQGLLAYLIEHFGLDALKESGIIVGYDARYNSQRFAQLTANIFLRKNIKVYLFRQIVPTPFVPFGILKYKCCSGIMVTASHNPKDDNGYKVYFNNGAQIIPPHDDGIARSILNNLKPQDESWDLSSLQNNKLLIEPFDEVFAGYFDELTKMSFRKEHNQTTSLKFTYSAMHGVGYTFALESFKRFNLKPFVPVKEQIEPDPEFPTVKFPNPEEGKSALDLSIKTANENESTIILANDPDADRLAVAERNSKSGEWKLFNGNEIAALLGWWLWHNFSEKHRDAIESDPSFIKNVYMLYSTVSSQILNSIAKKEGFSSEDTLTGFKWMGNRAHELIRDDKHVLFSFEEAIGFMCSSSVLDKDGVTAEAVMAEMAIYLNEIEKRTLGDKLDWIYDTYGYHVTNNSYFLCYEKENIDKMFHNIRNYNRNESNSNEEFAYPNKCGPYKIDKIRDLTTDLVIDFTKNGAITKPTLPSSKSSHMITFYFENGCILTLRTSGTEPKIKWYSEMKQTNPSMSRQEVKDQLDDLIRHVIIEFYQPEANNLKARPT